MEVQRKKGGKKIFKQPGIFLVGLMVLVVAVAGCTSSGPQVDNNQQDSESKENIAGAQQIHGTVFITDSDNKTRIFFVGLPKGLEYSNEVLIESELKKIIGHSKLIPPEPEISKKQAKKQIQNHIENKFPGQEIEIKTLELKYVDMQDLKGPGNYRTNYYSLVKHNDNYSYIPLNPGTGEIGRDVLVEHSIDRPTTDDYKRLLEQKRRIKTKALEALEGKGISKEEIIKSYRIDYRVTNFTALRKYD